MFSLALLDASIIGGGGLGGVAIDCLRDRRRALAASLLHRKATDARGFYAVYAGLIAVAGGFGAVRDSDALLGLLTNAVQALAGRAAAVSHGVSAAVVQRQGRARPLGQRTLAQFVHRRG